MPSARPTNSERTVIRAGYGIFYDGFEEQDEVNAASHYPFLGAQTLTGVPVTNILSTTQAIPAITTIRPAQPSDLGGIYAPNPKQNPYVQQWSFSIQRSLTGNTKLDVSYQGSESTHLPTRYNINQPIYYNPANPLSVAARRPLYNFTGDVFPQITGLSANYNAGTVKVEHQSRLLVLTAAYTFSKSLDVRSGTFGIGADINGWAAPMDSHNFRRDYGASSFDITHRAVFSFVHELPIGRGKPFLGNINRPLDYVIGGWQVNGIAIFQTGFPFSIAANDVGGLLDTYAQRADVVGNPYPAGFHKSIDQWFNTSAFAQPAPGLFGNSGRNILRAPGSANWDISLFKNFSFTERVRFQLRGESFNTFNHANFGVPNYNVGAGAAFGTITSASPGRILQVAGKVIF